MLLFSLVFDYRSLKNDGKDNINEILERRMLGNYFRNLKDKIKFHQKFGGNSVIYSNSGCNLVYLWVNLNLLLMI